MKKLLLFMVLAIAGSLQAQLTVTPGAGGTTISTALAGSGLTISNVTINCPANAYGTFANGGASGMGITNGLMLTTGNINQIPGSGNVNDDFSTCNGTLSSDPQIATVIGGASINDACIVEFDVVPQCNNLNIVFVFGSDEYTNYVSAGFNDGFGFFVSGPNPGGGNYVNQNFALLPSGTPVSIDNVNTTTNSGFFVNNNAGGAANHFDGFTSVLSPNIPVTACQTYHFKIAIADAADCIIDSGVLIDIIQCSIPITLTPSSTPQSCSALGSASVSVTGGVGPFTYSWSPGGQTTATASNLTAGTYTCTVNDALSCTPPQMVNVVVGSTGTPPTVTVPANNAYCAGATVPASVFTSNPAGATFTWTNSNTSIGLAAASGSGNVPSFSAVNASSVPVTTTISVTPTLSGCVGTPVNYTITVNPTPIVTVNPDLTQCAGTTVTSTVFSSTPTGATFNWTNSNTGIGLASAGTGNQPNFTATNTGSTSITGTVTVTPTLNGCVGNPDTYTITIHPIPTMTPPTSITQCGGTVPAINFTSNPPGASFDWTNSNTAIGLGASGTGNISSFTGTNGSSGPISGNISVTPTLNGCVGTPVNFNITIDPTPVISPITDVIACTNTTVTGINFTVVPSNATVTWTNSNTAIGLGTNGNGNIASFTGTNNTGSPISGTIVVNASANGCSAPPENFTITISQGPTVDPIADIVVCNNATVPASAFTSNPNGATFSWTNSDPSIGLNGSGNGNTPIFNGINPTVNPIVATVSVTPNIGSCVGPPVTYTITINPTPILTAQNNGPICVGSNLNLTGTGPIGATYSWTGTNGFTSNVPNPVITNATLGASGTYTLTVDLNGCIGTASTNASVTSSQMAQLTPAGPFCANEPSVNLVSNLPNGTWSGNGIINPVTGQFSPSSAQIGLNTITFTPNGSCGLPSTMDILINPLPTVSFSSPDLLGCVPFTTTLTDQTNPASVSVVWDFGDGTSSTQTGTVSHTFNAVGCNTITLTSTSAAGCTSSTSTQNYICVTPFANASFQVDDATQTIIYPVFQTLNNSTNATNYQWLFGDGSSSTEFNPLHIYEGDPGSYVITLIANNTGNCPDTAHITVVIEDILIFYVPNAFTPDGDEYNNTFQPVFTSGFDPQNFNLLLFDRWGEIIFESNDADKGWDGSYHGQLCKEGVYTWTIQFKDANNDKKRTYTGHVTLLK